jgi:ribonuclease BN (tRNA processing enzyme)
MRLDIVGAGPAFTNRQGAAGAAYLVRSTGAAILLDIGQGAFPRLAGLLDPADLDLILISHLHPDHFVDLVSVRHYLRWGPGHPRRVKVAGPAGLRERLDNVNGEPGFTAAALEVESLEPGSLRAGSLAIEIASVTHAASSFAFRVDTGGPGLVYSGDCGRAEDLEPLIRPGDTLLAEVSFGPGPVPSDVAHLDGPMVGALAARTGTRRVLLTHLLMGFDRDATIDSVKAAFDGPVALVDPGDMFALGH